MKDIHTKSLSLLEKKGKEKKEKSVQSINHKINV